MAERQKYSTTILDKQITTNVVVVYWCTFNKKHLLNFKIKKHVLTPVTEIGRDDKEIGRISQILAKDVTVHEFTLRRQRTNHDGNNSKLALATETTTVAYSSQNKDLRDRRRQRVQ